MRKVRQDGGIRYHVNVLQAMVSIHKRLSAGKHVTGTKRGKTCKEWRARENALNNLVNIGLKTQLSVLIGQITFSVMFQPKLVEMNRRKTKAST